jgi:hypothetical protein
MPDVAPHPSAIAKKHICPLGQSELVVQLTGGASLVASVAASLVVCEVVEHPASKRHKTKRIRHDESTAEARQRLAARVDELLHREAEILFAIVLVDGGPELQRRCFA